MNVNCQDFKYKELTEKFIKIIFRVYNKLGYDFMKKVYENATMIEIKKEGISAVSQSAIKVFCKCEVMGEYCADILVDNKLFGKIRILIK